ncbi:MAG: dihydropteroate synthase, partial [Aliifodinibius sp.]|nr:dihydropteroate synthase [Fodinibius sp.]NIV15002.1 dihydropteroate synthase [Fodinibius sp.]NIY28841.1 dihydropteroate synthase [Fodinibius sp.]
YPLLLGASRKSFIGFGLKDSRKDRTIGSITSLIYGLLNGAKIVRVHDVEETKQALQIVESIQNLKANS